MLTLSHFPFCWDSLRPRHTAIHSPLYIFMRSYQCWSYRLSVKSLAFLCRSFFMSSRSLSSWHYHISNDHSPSLPLKNWTLSGWISLAQVFNSWKICCVHGQVMRRSVIRQNCLLTEMFCPPRKRNIIPFCLLPSVGLGPLNYKAHCLKQKWRKNILWMDLLFFSHFPLTLCPPCLLIIQFDQKDSTLILAPLVAILSATLPAHCPVVVVVGFFFFPAFRAFVALLEASHSSGNHLCV